MQSCLGAGYTGQVQISRFLTRLFANSTLSSPARRDMEIVLGRTLSYSPAIFLRMNISPPRLMMMEEWNELIR